MKTQIKLTNDAHTDSAFLRLPTEDGNPSIYALEGTWYTATARDAGGNEYNVYWTILDGWDGEDGGDACDWDNPAAVVCNGKDVTDKVALAW